MPIKIQFLTGDSSDIFDWINCTTFDDDEEEQIDLGVLLCKLREHYCGSLTFREQRNGLENLCQGQHEDAVDFLMRVGNAVNSLSKDWGWTMNAAELEALQYEVSLNGLKPDITHVLNSEAAHTGQLTPDQIYEAVKRHETYVARNQRLEGKSPYMGQKRAMPKTQGTYKPRFPKMTAFAVSTKGVDKPVDRWDQWTVHSWLP